MNTAAVRCPIATEAAAMRRRDALAQMNRGSQPLLAGDAMDYVVLASPHATEDTTHARTRSSIVAPSRVRGRRTELRHSIFEILVSGY